MCAPSSATFISVVASPTRTPRHAVAHRRGHLEDALRNFKAHAALVADSGNADTVREAQAYLLTAHSALADAAARGGNCASARAHLDACLVAATAAENGAAAAAALHQLGLLAQAQAQWQEAIDFQQRFLDAPRPVRAAPKRASTRRCKGGHPHFLLRVPCRRALRTAQHAQPPTSRSPSAMTHSAPATPLSLRSRCTPT